MIFSRDQRQSAIRAQRPGTGGTSGAGPASASGAELPTAGRYVRIAYLAGYAVGVDQAGRGFGPTQCRGYGGRATDRACGASSRVGSAGGRQATVAAYRRHRSAHVERGASQTRDRCHRRSACAVGLRGHVSTATALPVTEIETFTVYKTNNVRKCQDVVKLGKIALR